MLEDVPDLSAAFCGSSQSSVIVYRASCYSIQGGAFLWVKVNVDADLDWLAPYHTHQADTEAVTPPLRLPLLVWR